MQELGWTGAVLWVWLASCGEAVPRERPSSPYFRHPVSSLCLDKPEFSHLAGICGHSLCAGHKPGRGPPGLRVGRAGRKDRQGPAVPRDGQEDLGRARPSQSYRWWVGHGQVASRASLHLGI